MTAEAPSAVPADQSQQSVVGAGERSAGPQQSGDGEADRSFSYLPSRTGESANGSAPRPDPDHPAPADPGSASSEDGAQPPVAADPERLTDPDAPTPTPTDAAPADAASADAASADVASADVASADVASADVAPTHEAPTDAAPTHEAPTDAAPADESGGAVDGVADDPWVRGADERDTAEDDGVADDGVGEEDVVAAEVAGQLGAVVGDDSDADPAEFAAAAVLDVLRASGWADAAEANELRAEATRLRELLAEVVRDHRAREASMAGFEHQQLHWLVPLLRAAHGVAFGSLGAKVALRTAVQEVPPEVLASAGLRIDYGVGPDQEEDR